MSQTATASRRDLIARFEAGKTALDVILTKGQEMTAEDVAEGQRLNGELKGLKDQLKAFDAMTEIEADAAEYKTFMEQPVGGLPFATKGGDGFGVLGSVPAGQTIIEDKGDRLHVWEDGPGIFGAKQWKAINAPEYKQAFRTYLRRKLSDMPLMERKTLEEGIDDQGGYTVPIDMLNRLVQRLPTPTRVAGMVSSINTSREFVEMMKVNYSTDNIYTTGFRVTKTGENPSSATAARVTDTNLFGTIKIPVHTFMITGLLTNNMIEDSALNILAWVQSKYDETITILRDDKIINGTGVGEPDGLLINPGATDQPSVINSGDASNLTGDGLMNLALDVPEQYEDGCNFLFNKVSTFKQIRGLKDLNDRYLFGMGTADSGLATPTRPTDLIGYPYVFSGLMPNVAANAYPVVFGDFRGYQTVNRVGFSIQVLRELYAELNQVALVGRVRFGGKTIEPWRLRIQKVSA